MPAPLVISMILAAGESSRMGRPKALLPLDGSTFLHRILEAHRDAGSAITMVVLGAHAELIRSTIFDESVECVYNAEWHEGRQRSVITGIDAARERGADAILLHPVDHPCVQSDTISALITAFARTHAGIVRPVHGGRHGHPVLFGATMFQALRDASHAFGTREVVRRFAHECEDVAVDDEGILMNIDTPEEYEHLAGNR